MGAGPPGEVGRLFETGRPGWVTDPPPEGRWPSHLLLVPVAGPTLASRALLALGWDESPPTLGREDFHALEGLAGQLALALSRQDRAAALGQLEEEMVQARAHLIEAERLAAVGQSMAGVVHDINAPLSAVTAFAQLIQRDTTEPRTRERAGHIIEGAQRAQRLIRELLAMARPHPPTVEEVDLHGLLQVAMDLERPQCSAAGIKLQAEFDPAVPRIQGDPHRLGQVFLNLLTNARQAMERAGAGDAIAVRTARGERTVQILVADNGPGVPPALRQRIFEWFFTTKPPGEGTGLGLAVSRDIVHTHGGDLRVEDTPGGGATFVVELPLPAR